MDEQAKRDMRNVIVFALIDGELGEQEKQFIDRLRVRLGVGEAEFGEICEQVRQNPQQMSLPKESGEATEAIRVIRIHLGDAMTAAVGRAKIAKGKLTAKTHESEEPTHAMAAESADTEDQETDA